MEGKIDSAYTNVIWNDLELQVKRYLTLDDTIGFVNTVIQGCFSPEGDKFYPELQKYFKDFALVTYFTNITLPKDINKQMAIFNGTDLIRTIANNIPIELYCSLNNAIADGIKYKQQETMSIVKALGSVIGELKTFMGDFQDVVSKLPPEQIDSIVGKKIETAETAKEVIEAISGLKA